VPEVPHTLTNSAYLLQQFYTHPRSPGSRRGGSRFDSRSDEDDDSDEFLPRAARTQLRGRRGRREVNRLAQILLVSEGWICRI